jgi:rhamnosyltransferase
MSETARLPSVIVTYHPDDGFEGRLAAIMRESRPAIVIDNSGDVTTQSRLRTNCAALGAELILNPDNRGLAAAVNMGFESLQRRGFAAAIVFDQDSTPLEGFSTALIGTARRSPNAAVIGANWRDEGRPDVPARHLRRHPRFPLAFQRVPANQDLEGITCVITSGSLFQLSVWNELGGFDEGLFLDLVDTDFCLRARKLGRCIAVSSDAMLMHRRGTKRRIRGLNRNWWPAFMPPLRLRYLFRNRVRLVARHGATNPHWITFELAYMLKILAEICLLEDERRAKLAACCRGTWDGACDVEGPIDS